MENKHENEIRRSFFKFMIPKFALRLRIPTDFVEKYSNILFVKQAKLRSNSGEIWKVKLERSMDDGEYYFTKGWEKFVEDLRVEVRECVVFTYHEKSIFDVALYGINGMERGISDESNEEDVQIVESKGDVPVKETSPLYFEICHKPYQRSRLLITKRFAEAAGLMDKKTVKLAYVPDRSYHDVDVYKTPRKRGCIRMELATGWLSFRKSNLVYGKKYSFEFKPNKNVIRVTEIC